jgi:hypothetical protein
VAAMLHSAYARRYVPALGPSPSASMRHLSYKPVLPPSCRLTEAGPVAAMLAFSADRSWLAQASVHGGVAYE